MVIVVFNRTSMNIVVLFFFFFQAEDGIRDLVRSRGLGDVYKRQRSKRPESNQCSQWPFVAAILVSFEGPRSRPVSQAVSYTHLTLPTSDLV